MAYFTYPQEQALRELLQELATDRLDYAERIKEHGFLAALDKNAWEETIKQDVLLVLENEEKELTQEQLESVIHRSKNIDMSDYNEAISEIIRMVEEDEAS